MTSAPSLIPPHHGISLSPGKSPCPPHTHLGAVCPGIPVQGPVHAVVTVGHLIGCHILDVPEVTGSLCDDACHLLLVPEVNLAEIRLVTGPCRSSAPPTAPSMLQRQPGRAGPQGSRMEKIPLDPHANARQIIKHDCETFDPSTLTASSKQPKVWANPSQLPCPPLPPPHFLPETSVWEGQQKILTQKKYRIHRGNAFPLESNSG